MLGNFSFKSISKSKSKSKSEPPKPLKPTQPTDHDRVYTSSELAPLRLGIIDCPEKFLCCLECPAYQLLTVAQAAAHVRGHRKEHQDSDCEDEGGKDALEGSAQRQPATKFVLNILKKYDVYTGNLADAPVPTKPIPQRFFLKVNSGFRCLLCKAKNTIHFGRSETRRREHFQLAHATEYQDKSRNWKVCEDAVKLQTFSDKKGQRKDFEVLPTIDTLEDSDPPGPGEATAEDLFTAWRRSTVTSTEVRSAAPVAVNLKTAAPFVVQSGWGAYAAKLPSVQDALALIALPANDHPEARLQESAEAIFKEDHKSLPGYSSGLKQRIMHDGTSTSVDPLKSLINDSTVGRYGEVWGRLLVFVVRLRRLELPGDPFYNIHLTPNQQKWADSAIDYCEQRPNHPRIRTICLELSRHLWSDPRTGFQHMTDNCFTDATTLFSLLINIGPDGAFADPEDITNHLAPIKYAMHLTMLCWAVKYAKDNQKATSWYADRGHLRK
ncbi:hypothetical protein FS749_011040 [Ceratobasidium sp. UAMH 11750]|nr:hypothetical protein FS749_011040 [Ceratobasidium sp. UAMH 11750]